MSDFTILTSDNPRYENPQSIIKDILYGISIPYEVIESREIAILQAIDYAKETDTIAILGKGAEKFQEQNGRRYPFSDVDVVKKRQ